ncbi:hypothetical protein [Paenibacillus pini]|uniref:Uncharacterized protein n=1 Tax=Paenibacillus pini JCM 16418 TaxID=1236976 RepID=W7YHW4_9BACL|nr:hypothetical protein [Paenibacillus pini]GAF10495.1 hypothetical protein JCM16418_4705 [Paenibacillus pini JCM 16418]
MLKVIAIMLGMLSPLTYMSVAQPDINHLYAQSAVQQAAYQVPVNQAVQRSISMKSFETMNGISLYDRKQDVLTKRGKPIQIKPDPITGCSEYQYKDATVGVCDGMVNYIHVPLSSQKMQVNGAWIQLQQDKIINTLGKPQYIAEDGQVFIRGDRAIKVYSDPDTGALQGVDFFDSASE